MRTVAPFHDHDEMVVYVKGFFYWHSLAEMGDFLILKDKINIELSNHTVALKQVIFLSFRKAYVTDPSREPKRTLLLIETAGPQNIGAEMSTAPRQWARLWARKRA